MKAYKKNNSKQTFKLIKMSESFIAIVIYLYLILFNKS